MAPTAVPHHFYMKFVASNGANTSGTAMSLKDWVQLLSFSIAAPSVVSTGSGSASSGAGAGKVSLGQVNATIPLASASHLEQFAAAGQTIPSVIVEAVKQNGAGVSPFLEYVFRNCVVESLQFQSGSEVPEGTLSLGCAAMETKLFRQTNPGQPVTVTPGWDVTTSTTS